MAGETIQVYVTEGTIVRVGGPQVVLSQSANATDEIVLVFTDGTITKDSDQQFTITT